MVIEWRCKVCGELRADIVCKCIRDKVEEIKQKNGLKDDK